MTSKDGGGLTGERPRNPAIYEKPPGNTRCNICERNDRALTVDHVPPESCLLDRRVELHGYAHGAGALARKPPISQSGLRFRTLCGPCNSHLGGKFDHAMEAFCNTVRAHLGAASTHSESWTAWCKPGLLIRSLFGHLLAASTDDAQTAFDHEMRKGLLNASEAISPTLRVFYWLHPHREVRVRRSIAMPSVRGMVRSAPTVFEILKFPPIGLMVTDLDEYQGLPRLDVHCGRRADADVEMPFSHRLAAPSDWPERVDEGNFVMGGRALSDAVLARPRTSRRNRDRREP